MRNVFADITKSKEPVIGHCCNCFNTMGAGVAKCLRDKWKIVYDIDCQTKRGDRNKLGTFSVVKVQSDPDKYVLNNYAQYCYGRERRHLDYEHLYQCLEGNLRFLNEKGLSSIAYPYRMGCENAGGNLQVVHAMIKSVFNEKSGIDVFLYNLAIYG